MAVEGLPVKQTWTQILWNFIDFESLISVITASLLLLITVVLRPFFLSQVDFLTPLHTNIHVYMLYIRDS